MVELRGVSSGYQSDKNVLDDCIPSVREQAVLFEVNTNTVVKTYDLLLQWGIIYTRWGLGYFVAADALKKSGRLVV